MIHQECADFAARINVDKCTCPHELLPMHSQMQAQRCNNALFLIHNWISSGWVPPHIAAELRHKHALEIAGLKTSAGAVAKLEEDNEALRFEVEQLRATMKQMTDWHNKIDDWLKARDK